MSYPEPRYLGEGGEVSAVLRPGDMDPDLTSPSGATHYIATHALTGGEFGLYKVDSGLVRLADIRARPSIRVPRLTP